MDTAYIADKMREMGCEAISVKGQNVMCRCPFHPDRNPSFGAHPTDGAHCFSCGVKFRHTDDMFVALGRKVGVDYQPYYITAELDFDWFPEPEPEPQPLNARVLKYYRRDDEHFKREWKANQETIDRRRLLIDPTNGAECFPIFDNDENYWGMVERQSIGKRRYYHYPSNYPRSSILIGENKTKDDFEKLWVVEGIRDLVSIETRFPNDRAVAVGGGNISDEQVDTLREFPNIVLALDNDWVGQRMTNFLTHVLPLTRLTFAEFDGKDPFDAKKIMVREEPI